MTKEILGIDLGTKNTLIYSFRKKSIIFDESTLLAISSDSKKIDSIGFLTEKMVDKNPYSLKIYSPITNGIINDVELVYHFLKEALYKVDIHHISSIVFSSPSSLSTVNRNSFIQVAKRLGAKNIYIESEAKITALGLGEETYTPSATLIVNCGAGYSDIALLSLGDIVSSSTSTFSGNLINEEIRRYLLIHQHLQVGEQSIEYIKKRLGSLSENSDNRLVDVRGLDTITHLPTSKIISSSEIRNLIKPLIEDLVLKVTDVLTQAKPDLISDIVSSGLYLCGGTANLFGLKESLESLLSIPVKRIKDTSTIISYGFENYISRLK